MVLLEEEGFSILVLCLLNLCLKSFAKPIKAVNMEISFLKLLSNLSTSLKEVSEKIFQFYSFDQKYSLVLVGK